MKRMRRMIVLLAVLALLVSAAAVVAATDITVDGNGSEWAWSNYQGSDDEEALVPDQYDIVPVYATMDVDDGNYCVALKTAENLYLNWGTWLLIYFDTDGDSGEGFSTQCQTDFGNIGAESQVYWEPRTGGEHEIWEWDAGWDFVSEAVTGAPTGSGQQDDTWVEICANAADLGIQADQPPTVKIFYENGDGAEPPPPDDIFCFTQTPENGGGQGCTPGYWKQSEHFYSWVDYSPGDLFSDTFGVVYDSDPGLTLLEAVWLRGGGEAALARHAVAALLNTAAGSGVSYEYSVSQVIAMVKDAYATGDFEGIKNLFVYENELGCPLD